MSYEELVEAIVEEEEGMMGSVATSQAATLPFMERDGDNVKISGEVGKEEVEQLVEKFEGLQGEGAIGVARKAVSKTLEPDTELELPEKIKPEDFK